MLHVTLPIFERFLGVGGVAVTVIGFKKPKRFRTCVRIPVLSLTVFVLVPVRIVKFLSNLKNSNESPKGLLG